MAKFFLNSLLMTSLLSISIYANVCGADVCLYSSEKSGVPSPNFNIADPGVKEAFRKLSLIKSTAFLNYRIQKNYAVDGKTDAEKFLIQLCGEYRDHLKMAEAKIRWLNRMWAPLPRPQKPIDPRAELWPQISAYSYSPWLGLSHELWLAKRNAMNPMRDLKNQGRSEAVEGSSVCETKYIFTEYVAKNRRFDNLSDFKRGLAAFSQAYCSDADRQDYYDYRGDSNLKPYSPESNAMIFHANSIARKCRGLDIGKSPLSNSDCQNYFLKPFSARIEAAQTGLMTWLNYPERFAKQFENEESLIVVLKPKGFRLELTGSNIITEMAGDLKLDETYQLPNFPTRLRAALNRHADWRFSAYNDGMGFVKRSSYSPFVASSYEVSQADLFSQPGATIDNNSDGRKRWLFIFRIHGENLYNLNALTHGDPTRFDSMWFDENSIGSNSLTQAEKAWDKLGTPSPEELDSILYLYNIDEDGLVDGSEDFVDLVDPRP